MHSCCKIPFNRGNLASWIPNLIAFLLWSRQCICCVGLFLNISFHHWSHWKGYLRAEVGFPLGKAACQGHCPCLHPFCLLFLSLTALTKHAKQQTPDEFSPLLLTASVPGFRWQRKQTSFTHLLGWLVKCMQRGCWTERLSGNSCKEIRFKMCVSSYLDRLVGGHLSYAWARGEPNTAVTTMVEHIFDFCFLV